MTCQVRRMTKLDIPQVTQIDREAFPTMWPPVNFRSEMTNRLAHYLVACNGSKVMNSQPAIKLVPVRSFLGMRWPFGHNPPQSFDPENEMVDFICGFVGLWLMVDESHIINIAVRESYRGKGIGELLLISSIEKSTQLKARTVTLEVRASNTVAQNLYSKYGFSRAGIRRGYYTDNKEDAFIMTTDFITSDSYQQQFQKLKKAHFQKMGDIEYRIS
ncbi:MAG: ribosomal protein S18-alanine N-acetyltransferase [Dehalococcoidales bacterium]|nr:ribosomal protein S18-alanine N-acetyltransferase [Dehalococcoidales bacterium]